MVVTNSPAMLGLDFLEKSGSPVNSSFSELATALRLGGISADELEATREDLSKSPIFELLLQEVVYDYAGGKAIDEMPGLVALAAYCFHAGRIDATGR